MLGFGGYARKLLHVHNLSLFLTEPPSCSTGMVTSRNHFNTCCILLATGMGPEVFNFPRQCQPSASCWTIRTARCVKQQWSLSQRSTDTLGRKCAPTSAVKASRLRGKKLELKGTSWGVCVCVCVYYPACIYIPTCMNTLMLHVDVSPPVHLLACVHTPSVHVQWTAPASWQMPAFIYTPGLYIFPGFCIHHPQLACTPLSLHVLSQPVHMPQPAGTPQCSCTPPQPACAPPNLHIHTTLHVHPKVIFQLKECGLLQSWEQLLSVTCDGDIDHQNPVRAWPLPFSSSPPTLLPFLGCWTKFLDSGSWWRQKRRLYDLRAVGNE